MIKTMILAFLTLGTLSYAQGEVLYSCNVDDPWLQKQNLSATVHVSDLDHAQIKINSASETVTCPLNIESVQDGSNNKVSQIIFKMIPDTCSPYEKAFNKNLRGRITLNVSTQPGVPPSAQIAWRNRTGYSDCKEIANNLKDHGLGGRFPQSQKKSSHLKGTK